VPSSANFGKRLTNLPALRQIGFTANRRLLGVQRLSHDPARGAEVFAAVTDPILTAEGTRIPGLRFADPRVQALLHALLVFKLLTRGFANRDLRVLLAPLLGKPPETITAGQMSYDLRRLRAHGVIQRIPHTHRYQLTPAGHEQALFLTRVHDRLIRTGLADLTDPDQPTPLRTATRAYDKALDDYLRRAGLAPEQPKPAPSHKLDPIKTASPVQAS
jgi:hypothetical protein